VTVQNLGTVKANVARVSKTSPNLEGRAQGMLGETEALCDQVIKELRTLSYLLHPPLLDEVGLVAALQWYVRGFRQRCGIDVEFLVMVEPGRLATDVELALFRVVQESLTNIYRHSGSPIAMIWLTKDHNEVVLKIRDEGRGMVIDLTAEGQEKVPTFGVGILGMRQRLRQLGGRLQIDSDPQGTTVTATVPISTGTYASYSTCDDQWPDVPAGECDAASRRRLVDLQQPALE
jgi:signal transduction histidine kinase